MKKIESGENMEDLRIIKKLLKSFQLMSYNPLAHEKYANLMMAIEDAATLNKDEIKERFQSTEPMKLTTIKDSDTEKETNRPHEPLFNELESPEK